MNPTVESDVLDKIAVIGISCRFPGAGSIKAFWNNLKNGVESVTWFGDEELAAAGVDNVNLNRKEYVKAGYILDDIQGFDQQFFGYSTGEARRIDPQQRLFLTCSWEAMEDAGYAKAGSDKNVGVFGGVRMSTYLNNMPDKNTTIGTSENFQILIGNDKDYCATRASYKLGLQGPSVTIQTACSTSLVAVHLACESLKNEECNMALAGGAALLIPQNTGYLHQPGMIFSSDGHCRAFDEKADGMVPGNGVGIVLLKRLNKAILDRDHIYAVIRGSAINNDGNEKVGYTAPSLMGQTAVISEALALSDVPVESLGYVETHGTATALGDPMEIEALTRAFRQFTNKTGYCALGSVKTNIGHADMAAGVASLIKTILMLQHKTLIPSLNYDTPNPKISFGDTPFFVNTETRAWPEGLRYAGVSSFGVGGTNAHLVLEEAPASMEDTGDSLLLPVKLSAATRGGLDNLARQYHGLSDDVPILSLATAAAAKTDFPLRLVITADSTDQFKQKLETFISGELSPDILLDEAPETISDKPVFLFPDSFPPAMAAAFYAADPALRDLMNHCLSGNEFASALKAAFGGKAPDKDLNHAITFIGGYAIGQYWIQLGIQPASLAGYGAGEMAAACLADAIPPETALDILTAPEADRAGRLGNLEIGPARIPLYSCRTGVLVKDSGDRLDPFSESQNFDQILAELKADSDNLFISMGPAIEFQDRLPQDNLLPWASQEKDVRKNLLENLGRLYLKGLPVQWNVMAPRKIQAFLPPAPLNPRKTWYQSPSAPAPQEGGGIWDAILSAARLSSKANLDTLDIETITTFESMVENFSAHQAGMVFRDLGIYAEKGRWYQPGEVVENFPVLPRYKRLIGRLSEGLVRYGQLEKKITAKGVFYGNLATTEKSLIAERVALVDSPLDFTGILNFIETCGGNLVNILKGEANPVEVIFSATGRTFDPQEIYGNFSYFHYFKDNLKQMVKAMVKTLPPNRKIRIIEVGAGTGSTATSVIPELPPNRSFFMFTDTTPSFLHQSSKTFAEYPFIEYKRLDIQEDPMAQGFEPHAYDMVIAASALFLSRNLDVAMEHVAALMAPGALFYLHETTTNKVFYDLNLGCLLPKLEDGHIRGGWPYLAIEKWQVLVEKHGFTVLKQFPGRDLPDCKLDINSLIARAPIFPGHPAAFTLKAEAPVQAAASKAAEEDDADFANPEQLEAMAKEEKEASVKDFLNTIICKMLHLDEPQIPEDAELLLYGMDSLLFVDIMQKITRQYQVNLSIEKVFQGVTVQKLAQTILEHMEERNEDLLPDLVAAAGGMIQPDPRERHTPFTLTDIQYSYWIGRQGYLKWGNVPCHAYLEFENDDFPADTGIETFNRAWEKIIIRHDMLRAVFTADGKQKIMEKAPEAFEVDVRDLRDISDQEKEDLLLDLRKTMEVQRFALDGWPFFDVKICIIEDKRVRFHFSLDLLIFDPLSLQIMWRDLNFYYQNPDQERPLLELSFRDHVQSEMRIKESPLYDVSKAHWIDRLDRIHPAPDLPLTADMGSIKEPRFSDRMVLFTQEELQALQEKTGRHGITLSCLFMSAYADVLSRWSHTKKITVNITHFNRLPLHPQMNEIIGDFTSVLLLCVDHTEKQRFLDRAKQVQSLLWQGMENRHFNGVKVLREMSRKFGDGTQILMPYVYTSMLSFGEGTGDVGDSDQSSILGRIHYTTGQTPQVLIDNQVHIRNGHLAVNWQVADEYFPENLIDAMYDSYIGIIKEYLNS